MWVRSQDKKILRDCNNLMVNHQKPTQIITDLEYYEPDCEGYIVLGEYKTEERALEVLDDIQKGIGQIEDTKMWNNYISANNNLYDPYCSVNFVYQMPEV